MNFVNLYPKSISISLFHLLFKLSYIDSNCPVDHFFKHLCFNCNSHIRQYYRSKFHYLELFLCFNTKKIKFNFKKDIHLSLTLNVD